MKTTLRTILLSAATTLCLSLSAQMGTRFPSERKVINDPKTGVELVFLTTKSGTGDSKIYQTHNQWTSDGRWVIFRSNRVHGEAMAVNEETGDIVQVTEGGFTGMLCVARKSMNLYHMREQKDKNGKHTGMEVVEVNLEKLFADSEAGRLKKKKDYERTCGIIPADMCSEGDMALDGSEEFVYFRLDKEFARKYPIAQQIAPDFGPRHMGAGPGGIGKMNLTTGKSEPVVAVHFKEGLPVRNVTIRNLYVLFRGGLTMRDVEEQRGCNPFFFGRNGQALINRHEKAEGYPEPSAHGIQPAWGLSISHAENIRLKNVRMETVLPDERPQLHFENTRNIRLSHSSSPVP